MVESMRDFEQQGRVPTLHVSTSLISDPLSTSIPVGRAPIGEAATYMYLRGTFISLHLHLLLFQYRRAVGK